ncbi:hypothetical protein ES703_24573 [subsurface metagenome]
MSLVHRFGLGQLRVCFHGLVNSDFGAVGNHLCYAVRLGKAQAQHSGHVPHDTPRLHLAEGDDLADGVLPVLLLHIVDDLPPAFLTEVDIDVGHGDAVGVEEPFKQEIIADGVHVGNVQGVGRQAPGGAAPAGTHGNIATPGEADEVHNNQEIPGVAHIPDNLQLQVQAGLDLRGDLVPPFQAFLGHYAEIFVGVLGTGTGGNGEPGQVQTAQVQLHRALLGDGRSVLQCLRDVLEQLVHLIGGL